MTARKPPAAKAGASPSSSAPAEAAAPLDLDAYIAEAEGAPFEFTLGGELYSLPFAPDFRGIMALERQRFDEAFRRFLGPEQWAKVEAADAYLDPRALGHLIDRYMAHAGVPSGESSASTASPRSTRRR